MADKKISALPASTTPLAGTEVVPLVQSGATKKVSVADLTADRAVSALSFTASSLTANRVTYAGTSGLLQDSANYTFDGTTIRLSGPRETYTFEWFNSNDGTVSGRAGTISGNIFNIDATGDSNIMTLSSNGNEALRVTATSDISLTNNLVIGTSGKGIDFSATAGTGTSELFDDYEEGLFDVTAAASTSGTVTLDYTRLAYAKIGRVVFVTGEIRVSAVASPVGDITISSLPFTNSGLSQRSSRTSFFVEANTLTGAPTGIVQGAIAAGGTDIEIRLVDNFSFTSLASYLQANSAFKFCFAYHAA